MQRELTILSMVGFFAFVIVCLLGIGGVLHKTDKRELEEKIYCKKGIEHSFLLCVTVVMLVAHTWLYLIDNRLCLSMLSSHFLYSSAIM